MKLPGIHHITAIASDPQRNLDFYRNVLGLRFVKRTVNFDDPNSYHFYYGDATGKPGTVLTFFPWPGARRGTRGNSQVVATSFAIPPGSLNYWSDHLKEQNIHVESVLRFEDQGLRFNDPDGLLLELIASDEKDLELPSPGASHPPRDRDGVERREDGGEGNFKLSGLLGFHAPTLQVQDSTPTQKLLTEVMGFHQIAEQGGRRRFSVEGPDLNPPNALSGRDPREDAQGKISGTRSTSAQLDLVERPDEPSGHIAAGTVHHIAFRTPSDEEQLKWREKLVGLGFHVSPVMDRDYFHSIYFREPNGILFEIATEGPGFAVDEPVESLGESLRLPKQYEPHREAIERALPRIS